MLNINNIRQWGHVLFISACLLLTISLQLFRGGSTGNSQTIPGVGENETALTTMAQDNGDHEETHAGLKDEPGNRNTAENESRKGAVQPSDPVSLSDDHATEDFVLDLTELDLQSTLPTPSLVRAMLAQLDKRAEKLIEAGDMEGLINLKLRNVTGMAKDLQPIFLTADGGVSYILSVLADRNLKDKEAASKHLTQYKASLAALHRISPEAPSYFVGKSMLELRQDNAPTRAANTAREGLTVLRRHEQPTPSDVFYDWKLTQIIAITLSKAGNNDEAIECIATCKARMEQLPESERGLLHEVSKVSDWLRSGKTLTSVVWWGKIVPRE